MKWKFRINDLRFARVSFSFLLLGCTFFFSFFFVFVFNNVTVKVQFKWQSEPGRPPSHVVPMRRSNSLIESLLLLLPLLLRQCGVSIRTHSDFNTVRSMTKEMRKKKRVGNDFSSSSVVYMRVDESAAEFR